MWQAASWMSSNLFISLLLVVHPHPANEIEPKLRVASPRAILKILAEEEEEKKIEKLGESHSGTLPREYCGQTNKQKKEWHSAE